MVVRRGKLSANPSPLPLHRWLVLMERSLVTLQRCISSFVNSGALRFFVGTTIHTVSALIQWHVLRENHACVPQQSTHGMPLITARNALKWWLRWRLGRMEDDRTRCPGHMDVGLCGLPVECHGQSCPRARGTTRRIGALPALGQMRRP